jgi:hypothetical protein
LESGGDISIKNKLGNPNIQNFLQIYGNMSHPQYLRGLNNQGNDGFEKNVEIQQNEDTLWNGQKNQLFQHQNNDQRNGNNKLFMVNNHSSK